MGLFDRPQPGTVFYAAAFGMLVGGMTVVGVLILGGAATFHVITVVVVAHLVAAALSIGGGIALLRGTGRTALQVGAVLELLLCGWWQVWFFAADEAGLTGVSIGLVSVYVVLAGLSLVLASRRVTAEYLGVASVPRDLPPSLGADPGV